MLNLLRTPRITRRRIYLAFAVAIVTDAIQLVTGPLSFVVFDQVLDGVAMILTSFLLGFHLLLLPTFVLELFPVVNWLPTWTGCVGLLVAMRKREQSLPTGTGNPSKIPRSKNSTL